MAVGMGLHVSTSAQFSFVIHVFVYIAVLLSVLLCSFFRFIFIRFSYSNYRKVFLFAEHAPLVVALKNNSDVTKV